MKHLTFDFNNSNYVHLRVPLNVKKEIRALIAIHLGIIRAGSSPDKNGKLKAEESKLMSLKV